MNRTEIQNHDASVLGKLRRVKFGFVVLPLAALLAATNANAQLYYQTTGTNATWSTSVWGTSASGPFTSAWSANSDVLFGVATGGGGTNNITISTTTIGNMTVNGNTTFAGTGTLSSKTGGSTVTVADNVTLTMTAASWSATASAFNWVKAGNGTWDLSSMNQTVNSGSAGITLNAGTLISRGAGNFGNSNGKLTINGGLFVGSGSRTWAQANVIGGNFGISNATAANQIFSGSTDLGTAARTITNSSGGNTTFSGAIANTGGLILTNTSAGTGQIILSGANTFSGGITLNSGSLTLSSDGAAGTGTLTLNGGVIGSSTSVQNITNAIVVGGDFTFGTGTNNALNGNMNLGGANRTITIATANVTNLFGGAITNGSLTISSSSSSKSATFTNANSSLSAFTMNGGTSYLSGSGSLGTSVALTISTNSGSTFDISGLTGSGLTIGSLAGTGNGTLSLGSKTLTIGGDNTYTIYDGVITGTGGIVKSGTGTLVLNTTSTNNTYSGGTVLNSGALLIRNVNGIGSGTLVLNGGTIAATNASPTLANAVIVSNNFSVGGGGSGLTLGGGVDLAGGTRTISHNGNTFIVSGGISNGGLVLDSSVTSRTMTLSGSNTFTGGLTVNGGTVAMSNNGILNTNIAVNLSATSSGAVLNLTNLASSGLTIGSLAGGANGTVDLGSKTLTVGGNGPSTTFSGVISNSGSLVKAGTGSLTLASANSYSGGTTLSAGTLAFSNAGALGTGTLALNGGTLAAVHTSSAAARTLTNDVTMGGNVTLGGLGQSMTLNGNIDLGGATRTFTLNNAATLGGNISNGGLAKSGAGSLTLSGNSTYSGATTVNAGNLVFNGTNSSSTVTVLSGASLSGSGQAGNLVLNGTLAPGNSVGTLTVGGTTFGGGGAFDLEMYNFAGTAGSGWDLLSIGGDLTLGNTSSSPFTINLISMSSSSARGNAINFDKNLNWTNNFATWTGTLQSTFDGSAFAVNTSSFANLLNGSFSVVQNGNALALLYTTAYAASSISDWSGGSGNWSSSEGWANGTAPSQGNGILFSGAGGASTNNSVLMSVGGITFTNGAGVYTVSGAGFTNSAAGIVNLSTNTQTVNNDMTLSAAQTLTAQSGSLVFGGAITNGGNTLTVDGSNNVTLAGAVSGSGGVIKDGSGTLSLSGANSYSGGTRVNSGRLAGDTTSLQGNISNNAVVEFAQTANGTFSGAVSGTGSLEKSGAGTLTLTGANSYSGGTTISAGGLSGDTASLQGNIANSGMLTFNQGSAGTYSGAVSGTGSLGKSGAATLTLTGNNTYTGGTTVSAGILALSGAGAISSSALNLSASGAGLSISGTTSGATLASLAGVAGSTVTLGSKSLTVGDSSSTTFAGVISGTGGLTKNGAGVLTLSGSNSYSGSTLVSGGTLALNGVNSGSGTVTVSGNTSVLRLAQNNSLVSGVLLGANSSATTGTLELASASGGNYLLASYGNSGNSGGNMNFTNSGAGAATLTFTAATNILTSGSNGGRTLSNSSTNLTVIFNGAVDIGSSASNDVTFGGAGNFVVNGAILSTGTGVRSLTKTGAGTLVLAGDGSTYSGVTTISSAGTIQVGNGDTTGALGTNSVANSGKLVFNRSDSFAAANTISGSGSLTKLGAGTLTLSGTNSYTGGTLVSAGALSGNTASLQGAITNSGSVVFNQASDGTYNGALSGAGGLIKSGEGALVLSGNNSGFSGAVNVGAGKISANADSALGTGAITITNGSVMAGNGRTIANQITIGRAGSTITNSYASALIAGWDFSTNTGGVGNYGPSPMGTTTNSSGVSIVGLTRGSGVGTSGTAASLAWGGDTWSTNANSSTAITDGDFAYFSVTVNKGYALSLTNFDAYNVRRSGTGPTTGLWQWSTNGTTFSDIGSAITWGSVTGSSGNTQAAISLGEINGLQQLGEGMSVTFRVANYGASGTGSWYLNSVNGTALDFLLNGQIATLSISAASGNGALGIEEAGSAIYSGDITVNNAGTLTAAANGQATFSGILSGAGGITKTGAGTVTLTATNTYTGGTVIDAGTLEITGANRLGATSGNLTINDGKLLLSNAGLSSSRNITLGSANSAIEVASGLRYTATNSSVISGSGTLNKLGTGTLALYGTNTYTGGTVVAAGTLVGTVDGIRGNVANSGTLEFDQSVAGTYGGGVSGSGSVVKSGAGTLTMTGSNSYSGATTVNAGALALSGSGSISSSALDLAASGTGLNISNTTSGATLVSLSGVSGSTVTLGSKALTVGGNGASTSFAGVMSGTGGSLIKQGAGTLTLSGANTYDGGTLISAGTLQIGSGGTSGSLSGNITNNSVLAFHRSDSFTNSQIISGSGSVTKMGAGTMVLTASNSFAGMDVNAGGVGYRSRFGLGNGIINLSEGTALGQAGTITTVTGNDRLDRSLVANLLLSGNVTFGLGNNTVFLGGNMDLGGTSRTLNFNNSTHLYGQLSNGGLQLNNNGSTLRTFSLFASNNYSGGTVVGTNMVLAVGHDQGLGSGNVVFSNASGAGSAVLRASTYSTDATQLRSVANNILLGSGMNVTVDGDSSTQNNVGTPVAVRVNMDLAGVISGDGNLNKSSSNTVTLKGVNTYTGTTTVNAGVLAVASGASIASSAATVNTNATLTVNGIAGDVMVNSGGTLNGSGTVGALEIASGGTLAVGNSPGSMTASSVTWNGGGSYEWEINNFLGSAGTNYDFLNVTGALTINASSGNKFIIDVISLLAADNTAGNASNFNAASSYTFAIATAAGGISGFNASSFDILTSNFTNSMLAAGSLVPGSWSITQNGNSINLNYASAIPEPTTGSLLLVGLLGALASRRRRN